MPADLAYPAMAWAATRKALFSAQALWIAALGVVPTTAHAQVHKCEVDGSVVYQQAPCDVGSGRVVDTSPNTMDPMAPARGRRSHPSQSASSSRSSSTSPSRCVFPWAGKLPADVVVYVAGGYGGANITETIEKTGHDAGKFDIDVNRTDRPVALALIAYDPAVWNIRKTSGTRIVAVLASGYYTPLVAGLEASVPVFRSSYEERSPCGLSTTGVGAANVIARMAFGRAADLFYDLSKDKRVLIGSPLRSGESLTSSGPPYQQLIDPGMNVEGPAALRKLVASGNIRKMTQSDYEQWLAINRACAGPIDVPPIANPPPPTRPAPPYNSYVVVKPFVVPAGLDGGNSVQLFVFKGTAAPEVRSPTHSTVHDSNKMKCK